MILHIVCQNKTENKMLETALVSLSLPLKTYTDAQNLKDLEFEDVVLIDFSMMVEKDLKNLAEKNAVYLIHDLDFSEDIKAQFEGIFLRPVRMGQVVDIISLYIHQKQQHKLLVPIIMGDMTLNPKISTLERQGHPSLRLTEKELAILLFLHNHKKQAVDKQSLLDGVWGYAANVETHTLETHIYRLRQKLLNKLDIQNFIVTTNDGYSLEF